MARSPIRRRFDRRVLAASTVYGIALIAGSMWFKAHPAAVGGVAYVAALLPALSIIAIFVAIGRYLVEERDEYLRMLRTRQTLVASGFALGVSTVWGFLENFGLAAHLPAYLIAVLWFVGFAIGAVANWSIERR